MSVLENFYKESLIKRVLRTLQPIYVIWVPSQTDEQSVTTPPQYRTFRVTYQETRVVVLNNTWY